MEAHKDSNKRALGLHYTRQTVITHTDKCGAASSRPIRTTSTSPPEALLHLTHSSRPGGWLPDSVTTASSPGRCHVHRLDDTPEMVQQIVVLCRYLLIIPAFLLPTLQIVLPVLQHFIPLIPLCILAMLMVPQQQTIGLVSLVK